VYVNTPTRKENRALKVQDVQLIVKLFETYAAYELEAIDPPEPPITRFVVPDNAALHCNPPLHVRVFPLRVVALDIVTRPVTVPLSPRVIVPVYAKVKDPGIVLPFDTSVADALIFRVPEPDSVIPL
jgi:hypothetical protein